MDKFQIKMEVKDNDVELQILDYIGAYGVELKQVMQDLAPHKGKNLKVIINSAGGSVAEGIGIYNFIKNNFQNVTTEVIGWAASISSIIFLAGTTRIMRGATFLVIHKPWTMLAGNADDIAKEIAVLDTIEEELVTIYQNNCALSRDEIKAMLSKETWINAAEAKDLGFATDVDESRDQVAALMTSEIANRYKLPEGFKTVSDSIVPPQTTKSSEPEPTLAPAENREDKEILMDHVPAKSAAPADLDVQNALTTSAPAFSGPKYDKFRDYFKDVYNATLGNTATFIPKEIKEILDVVAEENVMRSLATVYQISGDGVVPVPTLSAATWGTEGTTITANEPSMVGIAFSANPLQGKFTVTDAMLEDNFVNVAKLIRQAVGATLGEGELVGFLSGTGTGQPQGIFTKTADITTATSGTLTANELVAFLDSLETKYRKGNEVLLMHPSTLGFIRGLVDTSKKLDLNSADRNLNGIRYVITSKAPAFAANTNVIVYGDLKRGYGIADRGNGLVQKLVPGSDALTSTLMYAERVDGKIIDASAFKVLKIKA